MDEMKLHLNTRFMRGITAKLLTKMIYKKFGCKVKIQLNELNIDVVNGEADISTNVSIKCNSDELKKILTNIDSEL